MNKGAQFQELFKNSKASFKFSLLEKINHYKDTDRKSIYLLSPHPDDIFIGMGAILAFFELQEVNLLTLTRGEAPYGLIMGETYVSAGTIEERDIEQRLAEEDYFAKTFDLEYYQFNLGDGLLTKNISAVVRVLEESLIADNCLVFCPSATERHPDHKATIHAVQTIKNHSSGKKIDIIQYCVDTPPEDVSKERSFLSLVLDNEIGIKKRLLWEHIYSSQAKSLIESKHPTIEARIAQEESLVW